MNLWQSYLPSDHEWGDQGKERKGREEIDFNPITYRRKFHRSFCKPIQSFLLLIAFYGSLSNPL